MFLPLPSNPLRESSSGQVLGGIHERHSTDREKRWGQANADACVNFACQRSNFPDTVGGGPKNDEIMRTEES